MAVKSLRELAQRACIRNVKNITDVGDIPYELLRPILLRIESPEQLALMESRCPQLQGVDAEIWKDFIKRDIPDWEKKPHEPRDPKNWAKAYRKLKRDAEKEMLQDASKLKKAFDSIKEEKEQNIAQIVHRARLPMRRPTGRQIAGARAHGIPTQNKRPASKAISESKMTVPTHELKNRTTKILQAPANFVADRKRIAAAQQTQMQARPGSMPTRPTTRPADAQLPAEPSLQDREARLRALTQRPNNQALRNAGLSAQSALTPTSTPPTTMSSPPDAQTSLRKRAINSLDDQDIHLSSKKNLVDYDETQTNNRTTSRGLGMSQEHGSNPREIRHGPDISMASRRVVG